MKLIIEIDNPAEARSVLDALETRGGAPAATAAAPAATAAAPAATAAAPAATAAAPAGDGVRDANGMEWDAEIHSEGRDMKSDGTWKVRRGKADEAKAAIAAFKASGGGMAAPQEAPVAERGMPGVGGGMPGAGGGMPGAAIADMPPPVAYERVEALCIDLMNNGKMSHEQYGEIMVRHGVDMADPTTVLKTNESLRAAVYDDFVALDEA